MLKSRLALLPLVLLTPFAFADSAKKPWWVDFHPMSGGRVKSEADLLTKWRKFEARFKELPKNVPQDALVAFQKKYPGEVPFDVIPGDFNCDGKKDYAISGMSAKGALATQLAKAAPPKVAELEKPYAELDHLHYQGAKIHFAMSGNAGGWTWKEAGLTACPKNHGAMTKADVEEFIQEWGGDRAELEWAAEHHCDLFVAGDTCGTDQVWHVWHHSHGEVERVGE